MVLQGNDDVSFSQKPGGMTSTAGEHQLFRRNRREEVVEWPSVLRTHMKPHKQMKVTA